MRGATGVGGGVGLWVGHSHGRSWADLPKPLHFNPLWQRLGHDGATQLSLLAPFLMIELHTQHLPLGIGGTFDWVGLGGSWGVGGGTAVTWVEWDVEGVAVVGWVGGVGDGGVAVVGRGVGSGSGGARVLFNIPRS